MRVDAQRDRRIRVPELLRDVRDLRAGLQHQTRERVAQVVDSPLVKIGLRQ
ncbi:MAG TPA: hypothetical protein VNJ04_17860 [Gemmatimonadaceae bacterium]|nr:hypothetical protein [Gemmatimonadaceae bacterium]